MPLIEGLGDEVTLVLAGFLLCVVLMLAWFSTHTSEIPLLREVGVIVVELSQRRTRATPPIDNGESSNSDNSEASGASSSSSAEEVTTTTAAVNDGGAVHSADGPGPAAQADVADCPEDRSDGQGTSTLRQRKPFSRAVPASPQGSATGSSFPSAPPVPVSCGLTSSEPVNAEATVQAGSSQDIPCQSGSPNASDNSHQTSENGPVEICEIPQSETPNGSAIANESVDSSEVGEHPGEEEIRRRRVQYFETGLPITDSETSSLSNLSSATDISSTPGVPNPPDVLERLSPSPVVEDPNGRVENSNNVERNSNCNSPSEPRSAADQPETSSRIRVKLKYMNETQRQVLASPMDTIGDFRRAHFETELQDNKWVRFIFNGQDLRDDARTLQACNVGDNCTMHCLITSQTRPTPPQETPGEEDVDDSLLGSLMYPLFTVVLLVVWYLRFMYRQYFSALSTVCLIGISFLLGLSYISSLRGPDLTDLPPTPQAGTAGPEGREEHQDHLHVD